MEISLLLYVRNFESINVIHVHEWWIGRLYIYVIYTVLYNITLISKIFIHQLMHKWLS